MWLVIVLHVVRMWGHVMFSHNAQLMCVIPGVVRPASRGHCSLSPFSLKNLIWSRISPGICVLLLESHTRWQRSQIREINLPAMDVCGTSKFFLIRQFGFREGLKKGGILYWFFLWNISILEYMVHELLSLEKYQRLAISFCFAQPEVLGIW